jgi:hypothetical protein
LLEHRTHVCGFCCIVYPKSLSLDGRELVDNPYLGRIRGEGESPPPLNLLPLGEEIHKERVLYATTRGYLEGVVFERELTD